MSKCESIEDLFQKFALHSVFDPAVPPYDSTVIDSFSNTISRGTQLTVAQSKFIMRLLKKYKDIVINLDANAESLIETPIWKNEFRTLDLSKKVFVEKNTEGRYFVCLKFPFSFKKEFESNIGIFLEKNTYFKWDSERKLTTIPLYDSNVLVLHEFLINNDFEIDDSFLLAVGTVEEIWNNQENLVPMARISNGVTEILNASEEAKQYWSQHSTGILNKDLLLARQIGFKLTAPKKTTNIFEKIACSSNNSSFWIDNLGDFFKVYKEVDGICVVVLDRNSDLLQWLKDFLISSKKHQISENEIKVCFRESVNDSEINKWIKENNLGGNINEGKIFIFNHKPAKWLFTKNINVKIVATNALFPFSNIITQRWLTSFPLFFHLGEIKVSTLKEHTIVKL